jgi:predicted O-linked N-acetylglucosamine transferase (SPINDLY family)
MSSPNRNDQCSCGSGKKYKQCCLKRDGELATGKRSELVAIPKMLQAALEHYRAGRLTEAEALYQQILQIDLNQPDALHLSGVIALQTGRNDDAIELIGRAVANKPGFAEAHNNLGLALKSQGKLDAAVEKYQKALQLNPRFAEAHNNLGNVLKEQGRLTEAALSYQKAITLNPRFAEAHNNLGNVLKEQGKLKEAALSYCEATSINPKYANAYYNLGFTRYTQGKLDVAAENYRKAIELKPGFADAYYNLGIVLQAQGNLDAAVGSYQQALLIKPDYVEAINNMGSAIQTQGNLDKAVDLYQKAVLIKPDYADAHNNIGNAFKDQGKLDAAIEQFHHALFIKPSYTECRSNLLNTLIFQPALAREEVYRAAQEYEAKVGLPLRSTWRAHGNDKNQNRRLRIGYVSPDFCNHAVANFAEPILANHDKSQVEIYCYAEVMREDAVSGRFRKIADHWHTTVGLSDDAMAQMIRDHQIDILVDLAGHTAKNRLQVFARKPAPIQITYLGYPGTTGLSAMDYRITDHYADPDGIADAYYSEHLLRLPGSLWCYRPSADMPEVNTLPALARGYLTFGSFNNFNKIDQPTLELWAELLRAVPTARLMMVTVPEGDARARMQRSFAGLGIDANRLEFHGKLPSIEFHRKLLEVDITLDPVTVNGATTTCESLWMGVPVMSLAGERFLTRAGLSILSTAGLSDFAAHSREDYLHLAAHLADNLPLLAEIHAGLRAHVAASPLIDEVGFTRNLENLYREVWRKWCGAS